MTIEEALRAWTDKAAMLRYLLACAGASPGPPDSAVLSGISDVCDEIEQLTRAAMRALDAPSLDTICTDWDVALQAKASGTIRPIPKRRARRVVAGPTRS
jgi:hypothetical protein